MMRLIILLLATVATAKPLFEEAPAFPPFAQWRRCAATI
jgi:hypothetical protein